MTIIFKGIYAFCNGKQKSIAAIAFYTVLISCLAQNNVSAEIAPAGAIIAIQSKAVYKILEEEYESISNIITATVKHVPGIILLSSQNGNAKSGVSGQEVSLFYSISNTGNGVDKFSLQTAITNDSQFDIDVIKIYPSDKNAVIQEDNISLTKNFTTPSLNSGDKYYFVVKASIPETAQVSQTAKLNIIATSTLKEENKNYSKDVTDTILVVDPSVNQIADIVSIDYLDNEIGGQGKGPEKESVNTLTVEPGGDAIFRFRLKNLSDSNAKYKLEWGTSLIFSSSPKLPDGFEISDIYYYANENNKQHIKLNQTIDLESGKNLDFNIEIKTSNEFAFNQSIYVRVVDSASSRVLDTIHNAVSKKTTSTNEKIDLALEIDDNSKSIPRGGTVEYIFRIKNVGDIPVSDFLGDITYHGNNHRYHSFQYYRDLNKDGKINDGTSSLIQFFPFNEWIEPGKSIQYILRARVSENSKTGETIKLKIFINQHHDGTREVLKTPTALENDENPENDVIYITTTVSGDIELDIEQALDLNCDGNIGVMSKNDLVSQIEPGQCIRYNVRAKNTIEPESTLNNFVLDVKVPLYTQFTTCSSLGAPAKCPAIYYMPDNTKIEVKDNTGDGKLSILSPTSASSGKISLNLGDLNNEDTVLLSFTLKIDDK